MIFADASALIAIIAGEAGADDLADRLEADLFASESLIANLNLRLRGRSATIGRAQGIRARPRQRGLARASSIQKKGTVMRLKIILLSLMAFGSTAAFADLEPWKDYSMSESVWTVTAIKVHSNMGDAYLEGLKKTWIASNEVAKKLGQIEEYHLYRSDFQDSGTFNLLLVVKFKNNEALAPTKARYDAFMKEWGAERNKKTTDIAQHEYPAMRDITGEYAMREITFK
jgi:hypothetical protein